LIVSTITLEACDHLFAKWLRDLRVLDILVHEQYTRAGLKKVDGIVGRGEVQVAEAYKPGVNHLLVDLKTHREVWLLKYTEMAVAGCKNAGGEDSECRPVEYDQN
jgi:hypothetical protein